MTSNHIADKNIAPRQKIKKLAVTPQIMPVMALCSASLNNED
jgi:hypothetical protein